MDMADHGMTYMIDARHEVIYHNKKKRMCHHCVRVRANAASLHARTDLSRLEHAHTCKVKYASTFNPGNNKDSPIEILLLIRCCKGVEEYLNKLVFRRYLHRAHCYSYLLAIQLTCLLAVLIREDLSTYSLVAADHLSSTRGTAECWNINIPWTNDGFMWIISVDCDSWSCATSTTSGCSKYVTFVKVTVITD